MLGTVTRTDDSRWTVFVRLAVGLAVFLPEGVQKLAYPAILGAGRFARIGIPWPDVTGPFVGVVEIVCGLLIVVGALTRLATVPLVITMLVALVSTKLPILLGHALGPFSLPKLDRYGFWSAMHESRADLTMLLGLMFLIGAGGGRWSVDCTSMKSRPSA